MSSLGPRLDRIRQGFLRDASPESQAVVARATEALRSSGIMERIPRVGSLMPTFELLDSDGRPWRSTHALERGPLVVSFYRGAW